MNTRAIAHFDLDAFFVSVEVLKNSALKGKPLIVGGGDRGVVAACSYEARAFGIHSAMPMKIAKRLCPNAIIISGDYEDYSKFSQMVTEIMRGKAPVVEKASIDEFYLDISGMDRFIGAGKFIVDLRKTIRKETGLPISYALASNKLLSKVGTNEVKPNGQLVIPFGEERSYLAPLAIEKMPGIGKVTALEMREMGIETIKLLSEIPTKLLANKFGRASGLSLSQRAKGIDETPVVPFHEQKSISTENTFHEDTIDVNFLLRELARMVEKIGFALRSEGRLTGCVTVKVRYANFDTVTKQRAITYTSQDHILLRVAKEVFEKLYDRRLLVRLIGVRYTDLVPGNYQINLFDDTQENIRLYQAIDSIKNRFGAQALLRGGAM